MEMETTMEPEVIDAEETGALVRRHPRDVVLMPVMDVALAKQRLIELQEFCAGYLQESKDGGQDGGDYGVIPGAGKKKVLLKSGAEKLCDVYGLADRYRILTKVEDFNLGLFDYTIECDLTRKTDEMFVGSGLGSCSSFESKYRWRDAHRKCPQCGSDNIIKGKEEYGGGWLCWKKKGGCGATFSDTDPAIMDQKVGRTENPDIIDAKNTVLKIAKKRAKIDAVIGVTRSSGIFTQDLEEHEPQQQQQEGTASGTAAPVATGQTPAAAATATAAPANETHAEKIARIKKEAAEKAKGTAPAPAAAATTPAPASEAAPAPIAASAPAQAAPATTSVNGTAGDGVTVVGFNVRNGPMVVKDGKSQPAWGPLYVITFSGKVKALDGVLVVDATTFDEPLATKADAARDSAMLVKPVIEPGKKKGTYNMVGLRTPDGVYWAVDYLKAHPELTD
jgi:hypothetical protein